MEGKCIIFSAPSGAGKTTIVKFLLKQEFGLRFSVSAATRPQRDHEMNGRDYHFMSEEKFKELVETGAFVEWEEVYPGHFYGTLKSEIQQIWKDGFHPIFDVDVVGGLDLKAAFGKNALSIFVSPPSMEILETRLRDRATESKENIELRLQKAAHEKGYSDLFDVLLMNDDLDRACKEACSLVKSFLK
ncbi:MAG: guanylate kinase [Bacteroidota bacterium]|nr:guanylate kinase [Bacteroidota bacterium]